MATKKDVKWDKLNDYITYRIIDSTLYLIEKDDYINDDSWKLICKKIKLLIEDNNISYINISSIAASRVPLIGGNRYLCIV